MIKKVMPSSGGFKYIKLKVVFLYWRCINIILGLLASIMYKKVTAPQKILIFRTGSLGDSICAIPAIIAIRNSFPEAQIDILSNTGAANLASLSSILNPAIYRQYIDYLNIDRVQLLAMLRKERYDTVIQLSQNQSRLGSLFRDMFFFRFGVGIPMGVGWEYSTVHFFKKTQEHHVEYYGEIERLLRMLNRNGLPVPEFPAFDFNITAEDIEKVEEDIRQIEASRALPFIGLVVGAKRPQNRWPIEYFQVVATHFSAQYNVIIIGGPEDQVLTQGLVGLEGVYSLCGRYTPIQSGVALSKCRICISNDTGPMHLAYSFGAPVVSIFSSRDFPKKWFPPVSRQNIVFRNGHVACSLCLSENCNNNICMKGILPDQVINAAEDLIHSLKYEA